MNRYAPMPELRPLRRLPDARGWAVLAVWVLAMVTAVVAVQVLFPPSLAPPRLLVPTWTPPAALFAPVAVVLAALLGIAAWLVEREPGVLAAERRLAWAAFVLHVLPALAWAPLLLALREPGGAFVATCLQWPALLWLTLLFGRVRPLAGYLLLPQVLWSSFALVLCGTIWLMNT